MHSKMMGSESSNWRSAAAADQPTSSKSMPMCVPFQGSGTSPFACSWGPPANELFYRKCCKSAGFMHNNRKRIRHVTNSDGTQMKYCPGDSCAVFLPLYQFGANGNMPDGYDTYCIVCNNRRCREKDSKRQQQYWNSLPCILPREYFEWNSAQQQQQQQSRAPVMKRDIMEYLKHATEDACATLGLETIPITPEMIYQKLFAGKRLLCEKTGSILTPECFLDHHAVRFTVENDRLNVKCNKCMIPMS